MKKPATEVSRNQISQHQVFEYVDDFPINLNSMKDIEVHQTEIENELETIFKAAFNKDTRLVQPPEIIGFDQAKKTVKFMTSIETSNEATFQLTDQIGKSSQNYLLG